MRGRVKVLRTTTATGAGVPGAVLDDGLTIACGDRRRAARRLQRAGREPMSAEEFLRGTRSRRQRRLACH